MRSTPPPNPEAKIPSCALMSSSKLRGKESSPRNISYMLSPLHFDTAVGQFLASAADLKSSRAWLIGAPHSGISLGSVVRTTSIHLNFRLPHSPLALPGALEPRSNTNIRSARRTLLGTEERQWNFRKITK